jgi:hypothetical protein
VVHVAYLLGLHIYTGSFEIPVGRNGVPLFSRQIVIRMVFGAVGHR